MSQRQNMTMVPYAYVLPRCTLALYADDGTGAKTGGAVWTAASVENVRCSGECDIQWRMTTGLPYPVGHATSERHEITFDGLWNTAITFGRTAYVLEVIWRDAGLKATDTSTITRTYIGVQTPRIETSSRDGNEFTGTHTFVAVRYTQT